MILTLALLAAAMLMTICAVRHSLNTEKRRDERVASLLHEINEQARADYIRRRNEVDSYARKDQLD